MKKLILGLVLMTFLTTAALATPVGIIFTDVKEPVTATAMDSYSKKAEAANLSILNLVSFGNASIENIAKQNGIKKIKNVDKQTFSILFGLFTQETFTVYGD